MNILDFDELVLMMKIEISESNFEELLKIKHAMQALSVDSLNINDVISNLIKKSKRN